MSRPPKVVIPGLNRGAGIPGNYLVGRIKGHGPAQLLNLFGATRLGIQTVAGSSSGDDKVGSTAHSETVSVSTSISVSLSIISSSLSGAISTNVGQSTSLSQISSSLSGVISTDVGQSTSLSQVSSSLSGAISSTTSLSTAVSTVISGSISSVNSRIDSLSTAGGGGGATTFLSLTDTPDSYVGQAGKEVAVKGDETGLEFITTTGTNQSTSLSQISASLSSEISSRASGDTSLSTVISGSISTVNSSITSLSTAVSTVDSNQSTSLSQISSSLSSEISSRASGDTSLSTVISGSISTVNSSINSLSTAIGSGGVWVELLNYDFAGTPASTKECSVSGYKEILISGDQLVYDTTAIQRAVQFSVDGGGTWFTASGDYQDISTAGVGSNNAAIFGHVTATASSRNILVHVFDNMAHNPINIHVVTRNIQQVFRGSATAVNRIRLMASAAGSGSPSANNYTSGTLRVYGR